MLKTWAAQDTTNELIAEGDTYFVSILSRVKILKKKI